MYSGLREKLIGEKDFGKGPLIKIIGEKQFFKEIRKIEGNEKHIFVYGGGYHPSSKIKINPKTFEKCCFDCGGVFPDEGIIYFRKEKYLWEGAPIDELYNIIPLNSIKINSKRNLKFFTFEGVGVINHVAASNAIEGYSFSYKNFSKGLRLNKLVKVSNISSGLSFSEKREIIDGAPY